MFRKFFHSALSIANDLAGKYYQSDKSSGEQGQQKEFSRQNDDFIKEKARQQSLQDSQGKSDFSGSGYNGPGNVDSEKRNSNMAQRNF